MVKKNQGMTIAAIGSIPLIMTLGNSMLIPILPAMKTALNLTQLQVSLTITVYSIAAAIFIPILGYFSDRFSRKIIIIPSLILTIIGGFIAGLGGSTLDSYIWLLIGRVIQGIGAAGSAPIAMALTGDLFKGGEQSRVLGIVESSNGLGKVLSPILGSILGLTVWYSVFYAIPVFSLVAVILTWLFIKEKGYRKSPPSFHKYIHGLLNVFKVEGRWLFICYIAGGVCLFTLFGILFFLSDVLEENHDIVGVIKGLILAIPLLVMVSTAYITGSKIRKDLEKMKLWIILGFVLMTLSYSLLAFFISLIPFLVILSISSVGAGLILPCINSLITGSVGKERRGFVTSLYNSVRFVGVAIGPPIFARLMDWSIKGMFLSLATLTFILSLLILLFIRVKGLDGEKNKETVFRYNYF